MSAPASTTVADAREVAPRFGAATPGRQPHPSDAPAPASTPAPRRRGRMIIWLSLGLAAAFVAGGLTGRFTAPASGSRALVLTRAVAAGQPLTTADIRTVRATKAPGNLVHNADLPGLVARTNLQAGQILTTALTTRSAQLPTSQLVTVGIAVGAGQGPADPLVIGDTVALIDVPPNNNGHPVAPRLLVASATVVAVDVGKDGAERISVLVPATISATVASSAASGRTAVILEHP